MTLILDIYDPGGHAIPADQVDLIQIMHAVETHQELSISLVKNITGGLTGRYWLIADFPLSPAMLVEIQLLKQASEWSVNYGSLGIARDSAFNERLLERVIEACQRDAEWPEEIIADPSGMPDSVAILAREVVKYRRF
ncbi:MAG TPA: hypothetical protein VJ841_04800 [Candidatus Saccharimonadales bacterium]|nr:hypothetical protein [Candidatus Saccharimonadales bacterium]